MNSAEEHMRRWIESLLLVLIISSGHALAAERVESFVRVQIYDYAHVPADHLKRAQTIVSNTYRRIGVRTEWLSSIRPLEIEAGRATWPSGVESHLTIFVITAKMAARVQAPKNVVGYAAVTRGEMGRVAFVIDDRIQDVAVRSSTERACLLGVVIAHEIGHLLMPFGSHAPSGLMRGHWQLADFRDVDTQPAPFSPSEAAAIRQTVKALAGPVGEPTGN
jgi:hypothetical protein